VTTSRCRRDNPAIREVYFDKVRDGGVAVGNSIAYFKENGELKESSKNASLQNFFRAPNWRAKSVHLVHFCTGQVTGS
jgi:hypothetical protein